MDFPLDFNSPPPPNMPAVVTLDRFQIGDPGGPTECWRLTDGNNTWTMHAGDTLLSILLAWLERNGYRVVAGSDPTQFRRV